MFKPEKCKLCSSLFRNYCIFREALVKRRGLITVKKAKSYKAGFQRALVGTFILTIQSFRQNRQFWVPRKSFYADLTSINHNIKHCY